jgi:hypothetical protein
VPGKRECRGVFGEIKNEEVRAKMMALKSKDGLIVKQFRLFKDSDIGMGRFKDFETHIVPSVR